jgi:hypothetical protein
MKKFYFMAVVAMISVSCSNTENATPATENDTIVNSVDTIVNSVDTISITIDVDSVDNVSTLK